MHFYTVLTSSRTKAIGEGLTYAHDHPVSIGTLVEVPLRKSTAIGIVIAETKKPNTAYTIKSISTILSDQPIIPAHLVQTCIWIAEYYSCTLRDAFSTVLPTGDWKKLLPVEITYVSLKKDSIVKGKKQQAIMEYLKGKESISMAELRDETGATPAIIKKMEQAGLITLEKKRTEARSTTSEARKKYSGKNIDELFKTSKPTLLKSAFDQSLLKSLIEAVLNKNTSAIILFPDIYSASQAFDSLKKEFPWENIFLRSGTQTAASQMRQHREILNSDRCIVIGTRSALFLPVSNPGLVLISDEHDWLYKNEQTPRYHARLAAEILCKFSGAKLILQSPTPSLESWKHAQEKSHRYELREDDYRKVDTSKVSIVDLHDVDFGTSYPFSPLLVDAVNKTLKKKQCSVLFLNHRGYATSMTCMECRHVISSPDSDFPMTVHEDSLKRPYLLDHRTGATVPVPDRCPNCGSIELKPIGAGTQRIEVLAHAFFPDANIVRVDKDAKFSLKDMQSIMKRIADGDIDILIGTQSALKAIDIDSVRFAAALVADVGLSLPHLRAGERTFQLLSSLLPVADRPDGHVMIQTFRPGAGEITYASTNNYRSFAEQESLLREKFKEPPYAQVIHLLIRDDDTKRRAYIAYKNIEEALQHHPSLSKSITEFHMLPSVIKRGKWYIHMKGSSPRDILPYLDRPGIVIDVDPQGIV